MSHTDARIEKLAGRGVAVPSIARKIGRPGDVERVLAALERAGKLPTFRMWMSVADEGRVWVSTSAGDFTMDADAARRLWPFIPADTSLPARD